MIVQVARPRCERNPDVWSVIPPVASETLYIRRYGRRTLHPVIVSILDNKDYVRVLFYSNSTTIIDFVHWEAAPVGNFPK